MYCYHNISWSVPKIAEIEIDIIAGVAYNELSF